MALNFAHQLRLTDLGLVALGIWLTSKLVRHVTARHRAAKTTLRGPPSPSFIFGTNRQVLQSADSGVVYDEWAAEYGSVYQVPTGFGGRKLVLCDPKAVNHFYSMERAIYVKPELGRTVIANLFGRGLLWSEGESHKRQRKALTPAFSNSAIRRYTAVFYDSAYKLQGHWNTILDNASAEGAVIDVEHWMNRVALDSIGIAGFAHDFRTLDGEYSAVATAFDSLSFENQGAFSNLVFFLGLRVPALAQLPSKRNSIIGNLRKTMSKIADELLEKTRKEKKTHITNELLERSVIGLLLKAEEQDAELHMEPAEILAQMNVLLLAGYETTSISMTWALIELAKQPEKQDKLRAELLELGAQDATWDRLISGLPYLDAVVLETLRTHPPLDNTTRVANVDDALPLSTPITLPSGEVVDSVFVPKGTLVAVPIRSVNQSPAFWGPDGREFNPDRWLTLNDDPLRAKEIVGHRHLVTFLEGPRVCLGKQFALAEFKAVLSVLIKNYIFEFPNGIDTELGKHRGLIPRPKVKGEQGACVPMRVRRVD